MKLAKVAGSQQGVKTSAQSSEEAMDVFAALSLTCYVTSSKSLPIPSFPGISMKTGSQLWKCSLGRTY